MGKSFDSVESVESYLSDPRWDNIKRDYDANGISSLRSPFQVVNTISEEGSKSLLNLLQRDDCWVSGLGAATTQQAVQMFNLSYEIIYISGWQVAAESNNGENTYPDLSLYPSDSTPNLINKINNTLVRKISEHKEGILPPIVADAESGFGGVYSVFNLTSQFIKAGVSGLHFEDQLASEKKCGHMGGKVVIPTHEYIKKLNSARLSSDVLGSPVVLIARTDALHASLITSDFDDDDREFLSNKRTSDGYFSIKDNHGLAIKKALRYAEYADVIWCETNTPDLGFAKEFADEIRKVFPDKILAYNLQFVSLAGFHSLASSMYELAKNYKGGDMSAIVSLQEKEIQLSEEGYTAIKHQQEVGGNYYETIGEVLLGEESELLSTKDSTESDQF